MKIALALLLVLQFAQRPPLTAAETLLEPVVLRAINEQPSGGESGSQRGDGNDCDFQYRECKRYPRL